MVVSKILKPNLRPLLGIENVFFNEFNARFWGKIYQELLCRWNHSIIIPGSRSKIKKTILCSSSDVNPVKKYLTKVNMISPYLMNSSRIFFKFLLGNVVIILCRAKFFNLRNMNHLWNFKRVS